MGDLKGASVRGWREELRRARAVDWLALLVLLCLALSAGAAPAGAAPAAESDAGMLLIGAPGATEMTPGLRVHTQIHAQVTGSLARVRLVQDFTNPRDAWVDGLYVFPLASEAAVDELGMRIGDRLIRGEIQPRAMARATFEAAASAGQRASLVDQQRPNLFSARVANIPPGALVRIEIAYLETLPWRDGRYTLHVPLALTPRYAPVAPSTPAAGNDGAAAMSPASAAEASAADSPDAVAASVSVRPQAATASIDVELAPGFPIDGVRSVHHPVTLDTAADGRTHVSAPAAADDRDFELIWQPREATLIAPAVFTERAGDATYALVMLTPPEAFHGAARARELTFVIDTSGSMWGPSIEQARAALQLGVDRLSAQDRFNIVRFSSDATRLFPQASPTTPENRAMAARFIAGLRADGGTEMRPALELAFGSQGHDERLRQIVFITDGCVSNEAELLKLIGERLGSTRLFTVGIGVAPNSFFLTEAARAGRGSFTLIARREELALRMADLFLKLEQPALTELVLQWPGALRADPAAALPLDLYVGDPLTSVVRLTGGADLKTSGILTLSGRSAGAAWVRQLPIPPALPQSGIAKLWARERIAELTRQRHLGGDPNTLDAEIERLALEHHLVSARTSLVAVEEQALRPAGAEHGLEQAPTAAPMGGAWAMTTGFTQTASWAQVWLRVGLALLVLAGLLALVSVHLWRVQLLIAESRR